mmetsp:Transcript_114112/g.318769  ORF Transcript_114112/g.318769 Transcript_114112/m.318769 type:complete len:234 (-) Transcript_114112:115-816(-)
MRLECPAAPSLCQMQRREQGLQEDHSASSQFDRQACKLHARVSVDAPQERPPCKPIRRGVRVLYCSPAPHCREHPAHSDHSVISQSTGHGMSLHCTVCSVAGQAALKRPGSVEVSGFVTTDLVMTCCPGCPSESAHGFEQGPVDQSPTSQSLKPSCGSEAKNCAKAALRARTTFAVSSCSLALSCEHSSAWEAFLSIKCCKAAESSAIWSRSSLFEDSACATISWAEESCNTF